jgi:hypothetical protein
MALHSKKHGGAADRVQEGYRACGDRAFRTPEKLESKRLRGQA